MKFELQSYRDDIESLAYVLLLAKLGELPWKKYRKMNEVGKLIFSLTNIFTFFKFLLINTIKIR